MAITWAIAAVIALYMPFESLALLRAIIVAVGFLGIHAIYINLAIREDVSGSDWNAPTSILLLCAALPELYPHHRAAKQPRPPGDLLPGQDWRFP